MLNLSFTNIRRFILKHFIRRGEMVKFVQRFVVSWFLVIFLAVWVLVAQFGSLKAYYLTEGAKPGGTFVEGIADEVNVINPLFPQNNSSDIATRLIFSGLIRRDANGFLEPDLAEHWEVNKDGTIFTVYLKKDLLWHDGQPLTAQDVLFTYKSIQDPATNSPLFSSWKNIGIESKDPYIITFKLPSPYTPFASLLTTGIVPAHLLGEVEPEVLRRQEFNQRPIGSGPFIFTEFISHQNEWRLSSNPDYVHGNPQIERFIIRSYETTDQLRSAYEAGEVMAVGGLNLTDSLEVGRRAGTKLISFPLTSNIFGFFNTKHRHLKDKKLRQAIVHGIDIQVVSSVLGHRLTVNRSPLLSEHLGYDKALSQLPYNRAKAVQLLDEAGWKKSGGGNRQKSGNNLRIQLATLNKDIFPVVAAVIKDQLAQLGIETDIHFVNLASLQKDYIQPRRYDILLASINLGADPDVYSYWHSSQIEDPGLNFSQYNSSMADQALEDGRTRQDVKLRAAKYQTFLETWRQDAPAIALLRPNYYYIVRDRVQGIRVTRLVDPLDRFYGVEDWAVNSQPILKRLAK
jgi:peptide/nickel transport system substrate-binding protein